MTLTRRLFAASSIAALALNGSTRAPLAQGSGSYRNAVPGYDPLRANPWSLTEPERLAFTKV